MSTQSGDALSTYRVVEFTREVVSTTRPLPPCVSRVVAAPFVRARPDVEAVRVCLTHGVIERAISVVKRALYVLRPQVIRPMPLLTVSRISLTLRRGCRALSILRCYIPSLPYASASPMFTRDGECNSGPCPLVLLAESALGLISCTVQYLLLAQIWHEGRVFGRGVPR